MKKTHCTSRAVFLFCLCCDARSMQATFADLTNANVCQHVYQRHFCNFSKCPAIMPRKVCKTTALCYHREICGIFVMQNYFCSVFCFFLRLPRLKYGLKIHDKTCVPKSSFGLQINSDHTTCCRLVMVQARGHSSVPGT